MKIQTHSYLLTPLKKLNAWAHGGSRHGTLLKIEWSTGRTGYSDLFPWPELGDDSLESLLQQLDNGDFSHPLLAKSLLRNSLDAWARSRNRSLFSSLLMPKSHGLLTSTDDALRLSALREMGFSVFKLKMTGNVEKDAQLVNALCHALAPDEKIRLDFNGSLSFEEFSDFCEKTKHLMKFVDLIEDPWREEENTEVGGPLLHALPLNKLAGDFIFNPLWPHRIVKTAYHNIPEERPLSHRLVATHNMDHPLGQAFALWEVAKYERHFPHRKEIHGVSQHPIYESTDFDWFWNGQGVKPQTPRGLGIGFDEILNSLKWEPL